LFTFDGHAFKEKRAYTRLIERPLAKRTGGHERREIVAALLSGEFEPIFPFDEAQEHQAVEQGLCEQSHLFGFQRCLTGDAFLCFLKDLPVVLVESLGYLLDIERGGPSAYPTCLGRRFRVGPRQGAQVVLTERADRIARTPTERGERCGCDAVPGCFEVSKPVVLVVMSTDEQQVLSIKCRERGITHCPLLRNQTPEHAPQNSGHPPPVTKMSGRLKSRMKMPHGLPGKGRI